MTLLQLTTGGSRVKCQSTIKIMSSKLLVHVSGHSLLYRVPGVYLFYFINFVIAPDIKTGLYTPPSNMFENADINEANKCYCEDETCPPKGLQNISPCQYSKCREREGLW